LRHRCVVDALSMRHNRHEIAVQSLRVHRLITAALAARSPYHRLITAAIAAPSLHTRNRCEKCVIAPKYCTIIAQSLCKVRNFTAIATKLPCNH
jgi:hypothetical protein